MLETQMRVTHSANQQRFGRFLKLWRGAHALTEQDLSGLRAASSDEQHLHSGEHFQDAGTDQRHVFYLSSGAALLAHYGSAGQFSIPHFYLAGDFIGLETLHTEKAIASKMAACAASIVRIEKSVLLREMSANPRLAQTLFLQSSINHVWATDRLNRMISYNSDARLAQFLLMLNSRQSTLGECKKDLIYCPITQALIGAGVGLTPVSVSRSLSRLKSSGLLVKEASHYRILNRRRLEHMCDFIDRSEDLNLLRTKRAPPAQEAISLR